MPRRSGIRFADKDMRQYESPQRFPATLNYCVIQYDREALRLGGKSIEASREFRLRSPGKGGARDDEGRNDAESGHQADVSAGNRAWRGRLDLRATGRPVRPRRGYAAPGWHPIRLVAAGFTGGFCAGGGQARGTGARSS